MSNFKRKMRRPEYLSELHKASKRSGLTKEKIKSLQKESNKRLQEIFHNGPGLLMDKKLRYFFSEFNNRLINYGPDSMPSSYQVMKSFFKLNQKLMIFDLLLEKDHLFSFTDFVDFATSSDAPNDPINASVNLPDSVIHSYSSLDNPHDLIFSTDVGGNYGIGGISFVKHGNIVSVMVVGGKRLEQDDTLEDMSLNNCVFNYAPGKELVKPNPDWSSEDAFLTDGSDMNCTIVLVEFDLVRRTIKRRFIMKDQGNSFNVITDDLKVFAGQDITDELLSKFRRELDENEVLFEIAKTSLILPIYFNFKITMVKNETIPIGAIRNSIKSTTTKVKPNQSSISQNQDRVVYKKVAALRIINTQSYSAIRRFTPPIFQVNVHGFWRKLQNGKMGKDNNGKPIEGRTWVHEHIRFRDKPEKPIQVLVKSRVAIARAIAEAEELAKQAKSSEIVSPTLKVTEQEKRNGYSNKSVSKVDREAAFFERKKMTAKLRWKILERDDFKCCICGADAAVDSNVKLDVDHIIPIIKGGKTELSNLRTLCRKCNLGKGSDDIH